MIGSTIAGYTIKEKIGQGGMSTVYRAEQRHMGRDVALKVIAPQLADYPGLVERFLHEARIVAGLQHPHILPVYDAGISEGASAYIVMAYMAGGSLHERIQRYPQGMPLPQVVRLAEQIASALDALHENGVIHRDIKPANILLDKHDNAVLTDFGLARVPGYTGSPPGTYAYAPPEVSRGESRGPRSDIYSFGVVAFEMLAGEPPYPIPDAATMRAYHKSGIVPKVSKWRPDLPPGVTVTVRQALHHQPTARPRTASRFAAALRQAAGRTRPDDAYPPVQKVYAPVLPKADTTRRRLPPALTTRPHIVPVSQDMGVMVLTVSLAAVAGVILIVTLLSLGHPPAP